MQRGTLPQSKLEDREQNLQELVTCHDCLRSRQWLGLLHVPCKSKLQ